MTAQEMKSEFLLGYDYIASTGAPGLDDFEISSLLTKAQERVVIDTYSPSAEQLLKGYDISEKTRSELDELTNYSQLTSSSVSSDQTGTHINGIMYDLPIDFLYALEESATTSKLCGSETKQYQARIIPKSRDRYNSEIKNPFRKPNHEEIWRMNIKRNASTGFKRHELITDGTYTIDNYYIWYLSKPKPIIITNLTNGDSIDGMTLAANCLLDSLLHRKIVDEAVKIAAGSTDQNAYQIKQIERQDAE